MLTGGAPAIGWFAYAPLTEHTFARGPATDLLGPGPDRQRHRHHRPAGINFIATILGMRAPGMTLRKVPFFVWTMLWTSVQIVLAMPPLTAALIMVLFDRNSGRISSTRRTAARPICGSTCSGSSGIPEVYILILPVFGMISEVIPVFSRKVLFGYEFMAAATMAIAFISLGVWAHHMFAVGMSRTLDLYLRRGQPAGFDSDRHQDFQLAGHDVRRPDLASPRRCCSRSASCRCS